MYKRKLAPSAFHFKNQRLWGKYHLFHFTHSFHFLHWSEFTYFWKLSSKVPTPQSGVRIWAASVSWCEIKVFNLQAWDPHPRRESWQNPAHYYAWIVLLWPVPLFPATCLYDVWQWSVQKWACKKFEIDFKVPLKRKIFLHFFIVLDLYKR